MLGKPHNPALQSKRGLPRYNLNFCQVHVRFYYHRKLPLKLVQWANLFIIIFNLLFFFKSCIDLIGKNGKLQTRSRMSKYIVLLVSTQHIHKFGSGVKTHKKRSVNVYSTVLSVKKRSAVLFWVDSVFICREEKGFTAGIIVLLTGIMRWYYIGFAFRVMLMCEIQDVHSICIWWKL